MVLPKGVFPRQARILQKKDEVLKTFRTRRSLEIVTFSESSLSLGFSQATQHEMLSEQSEFIE
jgi:hypothetical protein